MNTQGPGLADVGYAIITRSLHDGWVRVARQCGPLPLPARTGSKEVSPALFAASRCRTTDNIVRLQKRRKPLFGKTRGEACAERDLRDPSFLSFDRPLPLRRNVRGNRSWHNGRVPSALRSPRLRNQRHCASDTECKPECGGWPWVVSDLPAPLPL